MKFKNVSLADVCDLIAGFAFKGKDFGDFASRVIKITHITPPTVDMDNLAGVDLTKYNPAKLKKYIAKHGDFVLAMTGATIGKIGRIENGSAYINQRVLLFKNHDSIDKDFLYYVLQQYEFQQYVLSHIDSESAQPNISADTIGKYSFVLPDLETQKKIGSFLRSFDAKCEINRRINDNLQQQLSTIYKSWYLDFSLVADSEFIETEYGMIPNGWHYAMLGDLCQSVSVTHKFNKEKLIFLNTGDIEDGRFLHSDYMAVKKMPGQAKKTIAPGDILYSEIRPINRHFAYVNIPSDDYVVSTKLMVIRSNGIDPRRLYHYLTLDDILSNLQHQAESRSGTFPQIRFENVSRLPILIADEQTESKFIDILNSVYEQIDHLNIENKKLAELRDAILPKLMSGEIDVSDIQL